MKAEQQPLWAQKLKGDWFNFLSISKNKAIGAMKWWRKITACKKYPCFIYCPDERSLFKQNDNYDWKYIEQLVKEQGGDIDVMSLEKNGCSA